MNPYDYSITVRHIVAEDGPCFEARVRELPDVAEYADSYAEAYELAIDTITTTAEALAEAGNAMPAPVPAVHDYSGRITVRVTKTLHRDLALAAEEEGVSLNLLIGTALAQFAGTRDRRTVVHSPNVWVPTGPNRGFAQPSSTPSANATACASRV